MRRIIIIAGILVSGCGHHHHDAPDRQEPVQDIGTPPGPIETGDIGDPPGPVEVQEANG